MTAASPIDYLVNNLCYYDFVYFNQKDMIFKVSKKGCDLPGYIQVTKLRKYWGDSKSFDHHLKNIVILSNKEIQTKEHHVIWSYF